MTLISRFNFEPIIFLFYIVGIWPVGQAGRKTVYDWSGPVCKLQRVGGAGSKKFQSGPGQRKNIESVCGANSKSLRECWPKNMKRVPGSLEKSSIEGQPTSKKEIEKFAPLCLAGAKVTPNNPLLPVYKEVLGDTWDFRESVPNTPL